MKFTLKNLKISRSLSEETMAFTADVYVDGVKAFHASNHGQGGCNEYHAYGNGYNRDLLDKAEAWVKEQPEVVDDELRDPHDPSKPFTYKHDLDHYIGEIAEAEEVAKDLKRILKKNATIVHEGKVYTMKCKPDDLPKKIKDKPYTVRESIIEKNAGAVILNDLPFDKALELFRKHG